MAAGAPGRSGIGGEPDLRFSDRALVVGALHAEVAEVVDLTREQVLLLHPVLRLHLVLHAVLDLVLDLDQVVAWRDTALRRKETESSRG